MPLTLHVDADRWRRHLRGFTDTEGVTIVPVAKGNGYGFGNATLGAEASALRVETMAAGTYAELAGLGKAFDGNLLVLSPWRPWLDVPVDDERVVHTVSRLSDLQALSEKFDRPRVVVEVLTSMRRHGIQPAELDAAAGMLANVRFEGFALHLPLAGDHADEAYTLASTAFDAVASSPSRKLWVSHLTPQQAAALATRTGAEVRLRTGSALWLGDRAALQARGTVLDVHQVSRGEPYGYRQRRASRAGFIVVVAGGTAHGVGMEAPSPAISLRQRAVSVAKGGLEAAGRSLSPVSIGGKQRWFAEPPHMQCSMIWLPAGETPPRVGDEVDIDVRFTATAFDRVVWT